MGHKDMLSFIEMLVKKDKPFLIIKYGITFLDITSSCYEIVTLGSGKLSYTPIDRRIAVQAINKFDIPILHQVGNRDMIWGNEKFKEKYKKMKYGKN